MNDKFTYLIEVMYHDTHNTEVVTITTEDLEWSMKQYQRNRKPFEWEKLDWKRESDARQLTDLRDTE
jgi:hypothetical protein